MGRCTPRWIGLRAELGPSHSGRLVGRGEATRPDDWPAVKTRVNDSTWGSALGAPLRVNPRAARGLSVGSGYRTITATPPLAAGWGYGTGEGGRMGVRYDALCQRDITPADSPTGSPEDISGWRNKPYQTLKHPNISR